MSAQARWAVTAIGSIALVTVIGACTSSGGGSATGSSPKRAQVNGGALAPVHGAGAAAGAASAPASGSVGGGGAGEPAPSAADNTYGGTFTSVQLGGAKIRIVEMTVQVKRGASVADQANAAEAIVMGAGGEVDADDRSSGRYAQATMVLKVPPEQLTAVLTQLSKLGIEHGRRESTQDVTARVADVRSRVDSAQQEIARLRVLYGHASKISDVIRIESELAQREGNLESLQAQQRALAAETTTATVTLTLTSPPPIKKKVEKPAKHKHHDSGFLAGLKGGWHAFTGGLSVLATVIGAVLPFAVVLILLALLARLLWPRFGSRLRRTPAPAPAAPPQ